MKTFGTAVSLSMIMAAVAPLARAQEKAAQPPTVISGTLMLDIDNNQQREAAREQEYRKKKEEIVRYTEMLKVHPDDAVTVLKRADDYENTGEFAKALEGYDEAIRLNPDYADAYRRRIGFYEADSEYKKTLGDYGELIRIDPKDADVHMARALAYWMMSDDGNALADYDEAIRLNPKLANAYHNRANVYARRHDWDKVIANITLELQFSNTPGSSRADSLKSRAEAYLRTGEPGKAIADFNEIIQHNEASGKTTGCDIYRGRGEAWQASGDNTKAMADYTMAVFRDEDADVDGLAFAYEERSKLYSIMGDRKQALADISKSVEISPNGGTCVSLGIAHYLAGQYDKTIADCNYALTGMFNPEGDARAYDIRGIAYAAKGDVKNAAADFKQAVESGVENCEVYKWKNVPELCELAAAEARAGKFERAVIHQKMALELARDDKTYFTSMKEMEDHLALYQHDKPWLEEKQYNFR